MAITMTSMPRGTIGFIIFQLLLVGALSAAVFYRSRELSERYELPPLRERPLVIEPRYDYPLVVTDDQLRASLTKIRPRFYGTETSIGHVDHNLRCWGGSVQFNNPKFSDGSKMLGIMTDHRQFTELFGPDTPPILLDVPDGGVRVLEFEGRISSPHDDHTMATLAEIGTPLDFPLFLPEGESTFRAMIEQSLRDFDLNQAEYEWSTVTYALFVDTSAWWTSEGRRVNFDMLAQRIMRQEMPQGVCMGNHRLHALVMLLRVDETTDILSDAQEKEILEYLKQQTALLVQHQHEYGFWNTNWPTKTPESDKPTEVIGDRLGDRIIATGHALEWWALAPEDVHPPRATLVAAGQWIVSTMDQLTEAEVDENSSFLSHAGRALALWRGKFPDQVELADE